MTVAKYVTIYGGENYVLKVIVKMKYMIEKDHIAWIELLQKMNGRKV